MRSNYKLDMIKTHTNNKLHLVLLMLFSFALSSCEKEPFDFRNKYCGEWNFKVDIFQAGNGPFIDTTPETNFQYEEKGKVWYNSKGTIMIQSGSSSIYECEIREDGGFYCPIDGSGGKFTSKNEMYYFFKDVRAYSGTRTTISGTR